VADGGAGIGGIAEPGGLAGAAGPVGLAALAALEARSPAIACRVAGGSSDRRALWLYCRARMYAAIAQRSASGTCAA